MNITRSNWLPILVVIGLLAGSALACGKRGQATAPVQGAPVQPIIVVTQVVPTQAPAEAPANPPGQQPAEQPEQPAQQAPEQPAEQPPDQPAENLPVIDYFTSEPTGQGGCYYLHWDLHDATAAYLNGQGITAPGSTEVCPDTPTTYTLRAENAAGSVEQALIVGEPASQPQVGPPANLQGRVIGGDVMLTWTDATGEASYRLSLNGTIVERPAGSTSYTWSNPPCGVLATVSVTALDASGAEIGGIAAPVGTPACGQADLVPINPTVSVNPVVIGQPFAAVVVVENRSDTAAGPFTVFWQFHAVTGLKGCCSKRLDGLAPHGQVSVAFPNLVTTAGAGTSPMWVEVDHDGQVAESDEGNNRIDMTLTIQ